jgi:hypothetical protein
MAAAEQTMTPSHARSFSTPELATVKHCLDARPWRSEVARPPDLGRDRVLSRSGKLYPTVAALYLPAASTATLFDVAFSFPLIGPRSGERSGADGVNVVLGASLGSEPGILAAWNRTLGRPGAALPAVVIVELTQIAQVVTWQGAQLFRFDAEALTPGLDLGVTYALYRRHEESLRRVRVDLWRFFAEATLAADVSILNERSTLKAPLRG